MGKRLARIVEDIFFPSNVSIVSGILIILYLVNSLLLANNSIVFTSSVLIYLLLRKVLGDKIKSRTLKYTIPSSVSLVYFLILSVIFPISPELLFGLYSILASNFIVHFVRDIWKISGHTLVYSTVITTLSIIDTKFALLFVLLPLVIWSRILLKRHTYLQVLVGVFLGIFIPIVIWLIMNGTL